MFARYRHLLSSSFSSSVFFPFRATTIVRNGGISGGGGGGGNSLFSSMSNLNANAQYQNFHYLARQYRTSAYDLRRIATSPPSNRSEGPATVPLAAVEVRTDGSAIARYVQKADAASSYGVPARDLRCIDSTFRSDGGALLPREQVIIVHLAHVRVLILHDSAWIFDPINPHVEKFIQSLQIRLRSRIHPMPFEFRVLEAVLVEICAHLSNQLGQLIPSIDSALDRLSTGADFSSGFGFETSLDQLLPLQGALHDFGDRVDATRNALLETLASDVSYYAFSMYSVVYAVLTNFIWVFRKIYH